VKLLTILILGSLAAALETSPESQTRHGSCLVSQVTRDSAPADLNADSGGGPANWYINSDRTIWAGPVPAGGWPSGGTLFSGDGIVKGQKTYWARPQGRASVRMIFFAHGSSS
jgi:hypothetical protein